MGAKGIDCAVVNMIYYFHVTGIGLNEVAWLHLAQLYVLPMLRV
jgi:hypothetical protein